LGEEGLLEGEGSGWGWAVCEEEEAQEEAKGLSAGDEEDGGHPGEVLLAGAGQ